MDEFFTALALGDNINLLGGSYGGWQAIQYALHFSNRLAKAVLLAPAATILPISKEFIIRMLLSLMPHRFFVKSIMYWLHEDLVNVNETGQKQEEEFIDEIRMASRCFKPRAIVYPTILTDKELHSLKVPTIYLVGEHEKMYSAKKAVQRLNTVAPQIKVEIIPQAGHDLTIVQAKLVNRKVLEFLKQP